MNPRRSFASLALLCLIVLTSCSDHEQDAGDKFSSTSQAKSTSPATVDTIEISSDQQSRGGIRISPVEIRTLPQNLQVTGKVTMDESHTAHIGSLADGIVESVSILPGDHVRSGQTLAHVHSHLIHETAASLSQAFATVEQKESALKFAEEARSRYAHLYSIQAASLEEDRRSNQQLVQAQTELNMAFASVRQEREHLSELVQVRSDAITQENVFRFEDIPIRTPIDGTVIARNITPATVVQAGTEAFLVSDLTTVWVTGAVNEVDIAGLRIGSAVQVRVQGYADEVFRGRVRQLGSTLDPATRTIPVRIVVPNCNGRLRPEMFATAAIAGTITRAALFIPEDAAQEIKGVPTVFVRIAPTTFRAQSVSLGSHNAGRVEVLQGLKEGAQVVASGAFMVKSEMLKGSLQAK